MRKILFKSLVGRPLTEPVPQADDPEIVALAQELESAARVKLGRGLSIREIDAGSCNGCELEIHALGNAFYDLERFGLRFVASPRHADVLRPISRLRASAYGAHGDRIGFLESVFFAKPALW